MEKWRKYEDEKVDKKTDENFVENIKTLQNKVKAFVSFNKIFNSFAKLTAKLNDGLKPSLFKVDLIHKIKFLANINFYFNKRKYQKYPH